MSDLHFNEQIIFYIYSLFSVLLLFISQISKTKRLWISKLHNYLGIVLLLSVICYLVIEAVFWFNQWYDGVNYYSLEFSTNTNVGEIWYISLLLSLVFVITLQSTHQLRTKKYFIIYTILALNIPQLIVHFLT